MKTFADSKENFQDANEKIFRYVKLGTKFEDANSKTFEDARQKKFEDAKSMNFLDAPEKSEDTTQSTFQELRTFHELLFPSSMKELMI